jgi:hypothetical protein
MLAVEPVPVLVSKPPILNGMLWDRTSVLVKKAATMPLWKAMYMWLSSPQVDHTAKGVIMCSGLLRLRKGWNCYRLSPL